MRRARRSRSTCATSPIASTFARSSRATSRIPTGALATAPVFRDFARLARQHLEAGNREALDRSIDTLLSMVAPTSIQASALRWCNAHLASRRTRPTRRHRATDRRGRNRDRARRRLPDAASDKSDRPSPGARDPAADAGHRDLAHRIALEQIKVLETAADPGTDARPAGVGGGGAEEPVSCRRRRLAADVEAAVAFSRRATISDRCGRSSRRWARDGPANDRHGERRDAFRGARRAAVDHPSRSGPPGIRGRQQVDPSRVARRPIQDRLDHESRRRTDRGEERPLLSRDPRRAGPWIARDRARDQGSVRGHRPDHPGSAGRRHVGAHDAGQPGVSAVSPAGARHIAQARQERSSS